MLKQPRVWTVIRSVAVLLAFGASLALADLPATEKANRLEKTNANDMYRPFLINNVFNYYSNNGDGSYNKFSTNNEGFEFYKGSGKTVMFEDGVVWGGYHKGRAVPKVGGSVYRHGLQAGKIVTNGTATTDPVADDAGLAKYRVFRVRPDINPNVEYATVASKLQTEEVDLIGRYESYTAQDIYDQYIKDWNEWPATDGAPYKDVDTNGIYSPTTDIPGQPGADQTLWYVSNDMSNSRTQNLAGCPPIGVEMQRTIWGYRRAGALGNTIFASTLLINKSGAPIDTMYMVQWADPDLGDAGDDFAGCDTTRSLGYIYNGGAVDGTYGTAVPAGGFDFFQGPIVASPGDSAIFRLQYRKGYRNLPMTRYVFFSQGIAAFADPTQGSNGDVQWYRLMNGTTAAAGVPFIDPNTNQATVFCLAGDPVKATDGTAGWVDGQGGLTAQDRRICLVTGPFTMAVGDTQELVVATLAGLGGDRLSSITQMRAVDDKAQAAYNNLFSIPAPPPAPVVKKAELDGKIILTWGEAADYAKTETTVDQGFEFQGYKVYEYPPPAVGGDPILLGIYDLNDGIKVVLDTVYDAVAGANIPTVVQLGTDAGLIRSITLTSSKYTGKPMVNGTTYYFGVTAYSYNANPPAAAGTHALENSPSGASFSVIPQSVAPGTRYGGAAGDTIKPAITIATGGTASDGTAFGLIVDPTKLTGHQYAVTFASDGTWSLTDKTTNKVVLAAQDNQTGDGNYAIVDGILFKVVGPLPGMKSWSIPNGTRRFSPVGGWAGLGLEGFGNAGDPTLYDEATGTIGMAGHLAFGGIGTTLTDADYHSVLLKLAAVDNVALWNPLVAPADANFSKGYRVLRAVGTTSTPAQPEFGPWIINKGAGYPYQDYNYSMPFSAWDVDVTPNQRLAVGNFENNATGALLDGRYWPGLTTGDNTVAREFAFIYKSPYTETADPALAVNLSNNHSTPLMWVITCARRAEAAWTAGDEFLITANHVNTPAITYTFAAPTNKVGDPALAKQDVSLINVYPNPYIGFNPAESNRYAKFVTFNHLPRKANIRIYNLAGVLIRTIVKDDATQFAQWDLNNSSDFPVSAGMYIAYIDMPDLGATKILKLGIVPERQFLDRW
jgi:hypothetical protein